MSDQLTDPKLYDDELELFFDTETSGLPNFKAPNTASDQPWIVQLAAVLASKNKIHMSMNLILRSTDLPMTPGAQNVHGISKETADAIGFEPGYAFNLFYSMADRADRFVCHNFKFDMRLISILTHRCSEISNGQSRDMYQELKAKPYICTMADRKVVNFCKAPFPSGRGGYKWPKLEELHQKLFNIPMSAKYAAHDALEDVKATRDCYYELKGRGIL